MLNCCVPGIVIVFDVGLSNMFGRAIAGALASLKCVNGLHLNSLSVIGAGISTGFLVLCTTFELLLAYAVVFGLCVGKRQC